MGGVAVDNMAAAAVPAPTPAAGGGQAGSAGGSATSASGNSGSNNGNSGS